MAGAIADTGLPGEVTLASPEAPKLISQRQRALRAFTSNRTAVIGLVMIVLIVLVAVAAPLISPHDPLQQSVRDARLLRVHILPNVGGDLLVFGSLWTASAIRLEASLSFVGLGVAPPTPTWGQMIREGTVHLTTVPLYSLGPGLALLFTVFAFNLVGDGLRDVLDPKARA